MRLAQLLEAIPLSIARRAVREYRTTYADLQDAFRALPADDRARHGWRLFYRLGPVRETTSPVVAEIERLLEGHGWRLVDWRAGHVEREVEWTRPDTGETVRRTERRRLVPVLRELAHEGHLSRDDAERLIRAFENDPSRRTAAAERQGRMRWMVVSAHPYDVAAMTTGRGWRACTDWRFSPNAPNIHEALRTGSIVAYEIEEHDRNIQCPRARVLIRVFRSPRGGLLFEPERRVYGDASPDFLPAVVRWARLASERLAEPGARHTSLRSGLSDTFGISSPEVGPIARADTGTLRAMVRDLLDHRLPYSKARSLFLTLLHRYAEPEGFTAASWRRMMRDIPELGHVTAADYGGYMGVPIEELWEFLRGWFGDATEGSAADIHAIRRGEPVPRLRTTLDWWRTVPGLVAPEVRRAFAERWIENLNRAYGPRETLRLLVRAPDEILRLAQQRLGDDPLTVLGEFPGIGWRLPPPPALVRAAVRVLGDCELIKRAMDDPRIEGALPAIAALVGAHRPSLRIVDCPPYDAMLRAMADIGRRLDRRAAPDDATWFRTVPETMRRILRVHKRWPELSLTLQSLFWGLSREASNAAEIARLPREEVEPVMRALSLTEPLIR